VLEIGTGWGGLAVHAAREYGCRVTTTTISREQHDHAVAAVRAAGLEDRVTVLLRDYRELKTFVADRPGHDRRYAIDAGKAHGELGWRPAHDIDSGLASTVAWYLENSEWCESVQSGRYRRERLGILA